MSNKLYVGNLAYSITTDQLESIFSQYGSVNSAKVIQDRATGQSKGFGFVEMATAEEAEATINALHGTEIERRKLNVNFAKPEEGGPRRNNGGFHQRQQKFQLL